MFIPKNFRIFLVVVLVALLALSSALITGKSRRSIRQQTLLEPLEAPKSEYHNDYSLHSNPTETSYLHNNVNMYNDTRVKKNPFGFTLASEKVNGRIAMVGITIGLVREVFTGESIPQQIVAHPEPFVIGVGISLILTAMANQKK